MYTFNSTEPPPHLVCVCICGKKWKILLLGAHRWSVSAVTFHAKCGQLPDPIFPSYCICICICICFCIRVCICICGQKLKKKPFTQMECICSNISCQDWPVATPNISLLLYFYLYLPLFFICVQKWRKKPLHRWSVSAATFHAKTGHT